MATKVETPNLFFCIILVTVAALLKRCLQPFLFIYGTIAAMIKGELRNYYWNLAIVIDQNGNVVGQYTFNDLFIKKDGYKFGNRKESISSALGKNKELGKFKPTGETVANDLELFEKNHVIKAIDYVV